MYMAWFSNSASTVRRERSTLSQTYLIATTDHQHLHAFISTSPIINQSRGHSTDGFFIILSKAAKHNKRKKK